MTFRDLPKPILVFLEAVRAQHAATLQASFARNAIVEADGCLYQGDEIRKWEQGAVLAQQRDPRPLDVTRSGPQVKLTILLDQSENSTTARRMFDWTFSLAGDQIMRLVVSESIRPPLPMAISAFVDAANASKLDGILDAFSAHPLVNDQLREYRGRVAVVEWASTEIIAYRIAIFVVEVVEQNNNCVVTVNVDGDYDKRGLPEPLVLTFYFSLEKDKIAQLIILRNVTNT
jgi:hypothetical protein